MGAFIVFWGQVYLVVTLAIALLKKEQPLADDAHEASLWDVYRHVWEVVRLPSTHPYESKKKKVLIVQIRHDQTREHPAPVQDWLCVL